MLKFFFYLFFIFPLFGAEPEKIRRVESHLRLDDVGSALIEAENLMKEFPNSKEGASSLIVALAANGEEEKALEEWDKLCSKHPDLSADRYLLEEMSWGVLKKGLQSTQFGVRLSSLVGAFLTHDIRALPILLKMLRDSNAIIRSIAVQMAAQYQDAPLKDEIVRLLQEEKVWMVRLEVIQTCGALRLKEVAPELKGIIQSEKTTYEERVRAIEALCKMFDNLRLPEWRIFARSNRSGMRHLACNAAAYFEIEDAKEDIFRLIQDTHPDVRVAAINALGLYYRKISSHEAIESQLKRVLYDPHPEVAITAAWAATVSGLKTPSLFEMWLRDPLPENRRLAAAAISASGEKGIPIASKGILDSTDPYVKANLAMGLLGHRKYVKECSDTLYSFLIEEKRMWMWDTRPNPLFQILAPSQVRHVDQIPNYPEAVDQKTRLNMLSFLAVVEDPRAIEAVKSFLKKKTWGITGAAAATLVQEGDDSSLEVVRNLLNDPDPDIRLQASFVLATVGKDPAALTVLRDAYSGADHEKKLHILEAMGSVGGEESFPFFLSALKEPFPVLRVAAASSLIQSIHR